MAQVKTPSWEGSMTVVAGDGQMTPFWLLSNRQGKVLPKDNAASLSLGAFAEPDSGKVLDYHYGAEVFGRQGPSGEMWLHQLYAAITYKDIIELRGGLWEEIVGSREPTLSTGSIIWSGNARPMPKVQIGTPGYINVPFTRGYAEGSLLVSHGWFTDDRFASDVWLHHKNAYLRLGGDLPVNVHYGFNHYAQWGGSSPLQELPYPSDFRTFLRVFANRSGNPETEGTPDGWVINKYGNSLGSRNYGIDVGLNTLETGLYHQDVFEDGSGMRRQNFPDGLWGGYIRFTDRQRPVQAMVYEFLHTKDQSGPTHDDEQGNVIGGNDNYFNHGHYQSGWSFHGFTIGTPLITSPILNEPESHRFTNNRVTAHHVGIKGHITQRLSYRTLVTYSRNYGRHSVPFKEPLDQISMMLEVSHPLPWHGLHVSITVAGDAGRMYGDNAGAMVMVRRIQ